MDSPIVETCSIVAVVRKYVISGALYLLSVKKCAYRSTALCITEMEVIRRVEEVS